jgi:hypothetical protein
MAAAAELLPAAKKHMMQIKKKMNKVHILIARDIFLLFEIILS